MKAGQYWKDVQGEDMRTNYTRELDFSQLLQSIQQSQAAVRSSLAVPTIEEIKALINKRAARPATQPSQMPSVVPEEPQEKPSGPAVSNGRVVLMTAAKGQKQVSQQRVLRRLSNTFG